MVIIRRIAVKGGGGGRRTPEGARVRAVPKVVRARISFMGLRWPKLAPCVNLAGEARWFVWGGQEGRGSMIKSEAPRAEGRKKPEG